MKTTVDFLVLVGLIKMKVIFTLTHTFYQSTSCFYQKSRFCFRRALFNFSVDPFYDQGLYFFIFTSFSDFFAELFLWELSKNQNLNQKRSRNTPTTTFKDQPTSSINIKAHFWKVKIKLPTKFNPTPTPPLYKNQPHTPSRLILYYKLSNKINVYSLTKRLQSYLL